MLSIPICIERIDTTELSVISLSFLMDLHITEISL